MVFSPDLCVCVCSSSFSLCVCSDPALSAGTESAQSWVAGGPLCLWAPPEHGRLVQASRPLQRRADRLPTRSQKAFEDQASCFARRSPSLPWRLYEPLVWAASRLACRWLFCWTGGISWASYSTEGQCTPLAGRVLDGVLGRSWGCLAVDWPGPLGRWGGSPVAVSCTGTKRW